MVYAQSRLNERESKHEFGSTLHSQDGSENDFLEELNAYIDMVNDQESYMDATLDYSVREAHYNLMF